MNKMYMWLVAALVMLLLSGCVATTMETRTWNPDTQSYTVESTETVSPAETAVGEPWVGEGTPWVYYNSGWYLNGILYGFYGTYGWWPYGYYPNNYIVVNPYWHGARWNNWYNAHPNYYHNFHNKYHGGNRWHGQSRHPGQHGNVRGVGNSHRGNSGQRPQIQQRSGGGQRPQIQQRGGQQRQRGGQKSAPARRSGK